ncbi:MAG: hypothetical protein ACD_79C00596G0004 [uncultured bacterium]|nr:MAG: hypothetical protein ACD_79C00596G0004 [uncultured bacterium]
MNAIFEILLKYRIFLFIIAISLLEIVLFKKIINSSLLKESVHNMTEISAHENYYMNFILFWGILLMGSLISAFLAFYYSNLRNRKILQEINDIVFKSKEKADIQLTKKVRVYDFFIIDFINYMKWKKDEYNKFLDKLNFLHNKTKNLPPKLNEQTISKLIKDL